MTPPPSYHAYSGRWRENAQLALDTIAMKPTRGIPTGSGNCMQWSHLETFLIDWLVEKGPAVGLMLSCSSSIAPGVPLENMKTLIEGFRHYREHGRR